MVGGSDIRVFVLSRERGLRRLLENLLLRCSISVRCFSTQRECLRGLSASLCDLLIINCGCGADELEVLALARQTPFWIPTLVLVEAGDVPRAVQAMKLGAFDCMEKPVQEDLLWAAIELGRRQPNTRGGKALTKTETTVLRLILAGQTTGRIADIVHRSARTVEVHRRNILRKANVRGTAQLVRWAVTTGVIRPTESGAGCKN